MTDFPDLRPAFPHTAEWQVHGQTTLHDIDFQPSCGYVSVEEARLLWSCARDLTDPWMIEQRKAARRWERLSDEQRAHYVESWREKWRA